MKESTALCNIEKLIKKLDYESAYVEIVTKNTTYTLNFSKQKNPIGFRKENYEQ
jgi:hypothetical protein